MDLTNTILNKNRPKVMLNLVEIKDSCRYLKIDYSLNQRVFIIEVIKDKEHKIYFK